MPGILPQGAPAEIIEATGCFILLRVDDRRVTEAPPFDQVKDEVIKAFKQEKGRTQFDLKLKELREDADIQELDQGPV